MSQNMNYPDIISSRTGIAAKQVDATIRLLDDKATIPFIARYRKERTGGLDEVEIASINEEYARLRELEERKKTVIRSIEEQGKMSNQLRRRID